MRILNLVVENKEILKNEKERIKRKNEERLKKLEIDMETQFEAEFPAKLEKIIEQREKELKVKYRKQLEIDKRAYESRAKANLEAKLAKEQKKYEAERTEFARQKSSYSVMLHQFEKKKKEMSDKLRNKELSLLKKQTEVKHELRHIAPEINYDSHSLMNCAKRELPSKASFTLPQETNTLQSNPALLPFSKALANKSINEMGNETLAPVRGKTDREINKEQEFAKLYSDKIFL
jgi:hypothetical protein